MGRPRCRRFSWSRGSNEDSSMTTNPAGGGLSDEQLGGADAFTAAGPMRSTVSIAVLFTAKDRLPRSASATVATRLWMRLSVQPLQMWNPWSPIEIV